MVQINTAICNFKGNFFWDTLLLLLGGGDTILSHYSQGVDSARLINLNQPFQSGSSQYVSWGLNYLLSSYRHLKVRYDSCLDLNSGLDRIGWEFGDNFF